MAAFWWMFTILFIATYVANLTAFFLTQEPSLRSVPFASFEELSKQRKASFGVFKGGPTELYFKHSKKALPKRLWAIMNKSESNFVKSFKEVLVKVRSSNYAFISEGPTVDYLALQEPCGLITLGEGLAEKHFGFACDKNKTGLCGKLDVAILELTERDVLYEIRQKWLTYGCRKNDLRESFVNGLPVFDAFDHSTDIAYEKAVTLRRFAGALLIALIGFIIATIALIGEIVYARRYGVPTPPRRMNLISDNQDQNQNSFHD